MVTFFLTYVLSFRSCYWLIWLERPGGFIKEVSMLIQEELKKELSVLRSKIESLRGYL